jgi:hypothetical protein
VVINKNNLITPIIRQGQANAVAFPWKAMVAPMNLMNCSGCGKLQLKSFSSLCQDCLQGHREDSHKLRAYLKENPRASVLEVYQETGIPLKTIHELVKR